MRVIPKIRYLAQTAVDQMADELRSRYGGMMKLVDIQKELGLQKAAAMRWANGLRYVEINNRKKYLVADVAEKICSSIRTEQQ